MYYPLGGLAFWGPVRSPCKICIMSYLPLVPSILAACKYPSKFIHCTIYPYLSMARYPIATKSNDIDLVPAEKKPRAKRLTKLPSKYEHLTAESCKFNPMELSIKPSGPNLLEALFSQPNLGPESIFQAFFDDWLVERLVSCTNRSAARIGQKQAFEQPDVNQSRWKDVNRSEVLA
jgi:hypothetical protein